MTEQQAIRVNFGRPMPIFPLDQAVVLPQQVLPLHIFEPRYRQMVGHALDRSGQIAMAVYDNEAWPIDAGGLPPVRPAVCVGQVIEHQKLPDGRYHLLLQGICRARIVEELPPEAQGDALLDMDPIDVTGRPGDDVPRLYREAMLEPVGLGPTDPGPLADLRDWAEDQLSNGPLSRLSVADQVLQNLRNREIPSEALWELIAFALLTEPDVRYALLAEGRGEVRVDIIRAGLEALGRLIEAAGAQHPERWPKGMSWN